jgi:hypothetical protein
VTGKLREAQQWYNRMAEIPSGPEPRAFDRELSAALTSSIDMDKLEGRKKNWWIVYSSDK